MSYKFQNIVILPKKTIDSSKIQSLFSIVNTFDINQIRHFASTNNMNYNVIDNSGKTLLHIIIGVDDITRTEKKRLDLVKFFIENGVEVDTPDSNNITPLHLACKQQFHSIVKYLIYQGALTNSLDNELMSPLHYTVQGLTSVCREDKIVGSIIDKPDKKDIVKNNELSRAKVKIARILHNEELNSYISHIVKTISNSKDYDFQYKIQEKLEEMNLDIGNYLGNSKARYTSPEITQNNIHTLVYSYIESIKGIITNEIHKKSLQNIEFKISNNFNDWGLPILGNTKILQTQDDTNIGNIWQEMSDNLESYSDYDKKYTNNNNQIDKISINLDKIMNSVVKLRLYLFSYVLSNQDYIDIVAPPPAINIDDYNYLETYENRDKNFTFGRNSIKLNDHLLRHKNSLTIRDSIIDFENDLYLQGFHDYKIFNKDINIVSIDGRNNILEIFADFFIQIIPDNIILDANKNAVIQLLINNNIRDLNSLEQYGNALDPIAIAIIPDQIKSSIGILWIILSNIINQKVNQINEHIDYFIDYMYGLNNNYINNNSHNELFWHFKQVTSFNDNNFIFISCLQAFLRINDNPNKRSFTNHFKIIYDALDEYQSIGSIPKLKKNIINNLKFIKQINLVDNHSLIPPANLADPNYWPFMIISNLVTVLADMDLACYNNIINALVIVDPLNFNQITDDLINNLFPLGSNYDLKPLIFATYILFNNKFNNNLFNTEQLKNELNNIINIVRPFEKKLIYEGLKISNDSSPIEVIIVMAKYYFENNLGKYDNKNQYILLDLISNLRIIYYSNNIDNYRNLQQLLLASITNYNNIGDLINAENTNPNSNKLSLIYKLCYSLFNPYS